jgi:hypothetical protein
MASNARAEQMEENVESPAEGPSQTASAAHTQPGASSPDPGAAPDQAEIARPREEMSILIFGFATGLSIAFIFLIYVVLEFARYLT